MRNNDSNIVQSKLQSVSLVIAGGTAAGTYASLGAGLEDTYDVCDGIAISVQSDGGIANGNFSVSIETPAGTPIEPTPIPVLQIDKSTPVNERFIDTLFDVKAGKAAKLMVTIPAVPGAQMQVTATFRLRRLLTKLTLPKV